MSRVNKTRSLEEQLAELQMSESNSNAMKIKKIPPAVPPKKKAQPQVPHSASVNTLREPSYSSRISPISNSSISQGYCYATPARSNLKDYANVNSNFSHSDLGRNYNNTYSNVPLSYRPCDDPLPPPPPPPPQSSHHLRRQEYGVAPHSEEYLPPPSPVSSNYSELVRATSNLNFNNQDRQNYAHIYQNDYPIYAGSQASTYESIYEPINPRPQSSVSQQINGNNHNTNNTPKPQGKEEEVDALTNLLVKSISASQDLDVFGVCIKCNGNVIGESSGCTAMGFMYHVECFSCQRCNLNLQGKPFYAVENQPYCEADYFETLEKCSVCNKPILDRILRATGKPYHPACFSCVVCGKSLDGIPFTVDAMNQIHCIDDFHKKFAPRCCVCELPIMPEDGEDETVRVVALDRSFHVRCYRCEDCGLLLTSEAEGRGCYPLDDHILCKTCNAHRIRQLTNVMTTDL